MLRHGARGDVRLLLVAVPTARGRRRLQVEALCQPYLYDWLLLSEVRGEEVEQMDVREVKRTGGSVDELAGEEALHWEQRRERWDGP